MEARQESVSLNWFIFKQIIMLFIKIEHTFHHTPFFVGRNIGSTILKLAHMPFPFLLEWQSGKFLHCLVPI